MLADFVEIANQIGATTKKSEKERLLAGYLSTLDDPSLERAVTFFSGSPFPRRDERVTGVGWSTIADAVVAATGRTHEELWEIYPKYADLGDAVSELFPATAPRDLSLLELGESFDRIAGLSGSSEKAAELTAVLQRVSGQEARFIVKILQNELRIGLQEGLVEAAVARAFDRPLAQVRQANMFTGDIGAAALLARAGTLTSAEMTLFQPFGFMLAQPEETAEGIVAAVGAGAFADDKYDGIRAQIHSDGERVAIYSRTLDEITHRFPEIERAAKELGSRFILDGEIVAWRGGVLPFATIQKRLGRSKVSEKLLADAPVVFFAFDLLLADTKPLFEVPLKERLEMLRGLIVAAPDDPEPVRLRRAHQAEVVDAGQLDALFDLARDRANEGLVVKDPQSIYTPGRRGKSWLKYKKALATLDCVVTAAEYGHGKRRAVLSDVTFAVSRDGELVNIGKAYSGLTDVEIAKLTEHFQATTTGRYGPVHVVEPQIVLEIAFDRIQESKRHKSGYALRFPRIAGIRDDKNVGEISTIDEVRRIYEGQLARERHDKEK
jgi:DNA ligase 1